MSETPWLKRMQNGAIGEARAKAFLMDRFWVLERSVDVQGADLLIQRNTLLHSVLDPRPPRLGVIQVKFVQDRETSISVPVEYTRASDGTPAGEFFLIVATGRDDDARLFLLSAADIAAHFRSKTRDDREVFVCRAERILKNSNFEVKSRALALARIDHALRAADFSDNRRYLRNLGVQRPTRDQIHPDYMLPISNGYGDIADGLLRQKKAAERLLGELEEVAEALDKLVLAKDPIEAANIFEEEIDPHLDGNRRLTFSSDDLSDEDLFWTARAHAKHLEAVRAAGIEGAYFRLIERFDRKVLAFAASHDETKLERVHVNVHYTPKTLEEVVISVVDGSPACTVNNLEVDGSVVHNDEVGLKVICYNAHQVLRRDSWYDPTTDSHRFRDDFQPLLDKELLGL